MKRLIIPLLGLVTATAMLVPAAARAGGGPGGASVNHADVLCLERVFLCPDTRLHRSYEGNYVGHDEPSTLFYSNAPGSGNSYESKLRLPVEAPTLPNQDGTGGTWSFQLHPAFWFGMALCENQSYPNPGAPCPADSDANIFDGANPSSPNWIGNHPGTGFLELQFYPPGWSSNVSCDAHRWCAAMVVFGLSDSLTRSNNQACLQTAGEEWANFAFITKSGVPQAPPDPLGATGATFTPDPSKDLFMGSGDNLVVSVHDSPTGLVTLVRDRTTGRTGSMTASAANGFAHPLFQPNRSKCTEAPYSFHPMYSTSSEHTRVPWAAHSYNVAFSDEIGHFEYCNRANLSLQCVRPKADADDFPCFSDTLLVQVTGCIGTDVDFDGVPYQHTWPGTLSNASKDAALHTQSFLFTSPLSHGRNYPRVAFEADLPAIEAACDTTSGSNCVNPPPGANFYPIYSTRGTSSCAWQEGGTGIRGTTNTFGGSSVTEFGSLVPLVYTSFPGFPGTGFFLEDFRRVLSSNPCMSSGNLP